MEEVTLQSEDGRESVEVSLPFDSNRSIALVACNLQRRSRLPDMSVEDMNP